ncbi:hypothetical protein TEA_026367 [Camellia sinensis var. sinensis]|uniref:Uncharacterized protein n=1 Tax=Camellia sinensis var. sinensis TaxID=542762 RepID=A0A4S4D547_CAMSN|nr:hypothetical protein TEA_026367 [Camellia sinensis var. sinensis]
MLPVRSNASSKALFQLTVSVKPQTDIEGLNIADDVSQDPAQDISIQLLEKLSFVTTFARETTSQLFRGSNSDVFGANERNHEQTPHPYPSIVASNDVEEVPNEIPIASDPLEGWEVAANEKSLQYPKKVFCQIVFSSANYSAKTRDRALSYSFS